MRNDTQQSDTEPCENCGTEIHTMPGMDHYVKLKEYTTTTVDRRVFCDRDCLLAEVSP